jgi:hypothetical protein
MSNRDLVKEGYVIIAIPSVPGLFWIGKPEGTIYHTQVLKHSCDCKAGLQNRHCCHLEQVPALIHRQIAANIVSMADNAEVGESYVNGLYADNLNLAEAWNTIYAQEAEEVEEWKQAA